MLVARDYRGPGDLEEMQRLVQRTWGAHGPPVGHHIGDLPWRRFQHVGRECEWPTRLWSNRAGEVVAWGWLSLPCELLLHVAPGLAARELREAVSEIVGWAEEVATDPLKVDVLDTEVEILDALAVEGLALDRTEPMAWHMRALDDLAPAVVPAGLRARHVRLPRDLTQRVAVHRAAFGVGKPSRVTEESYGRVAAAWPYREELDWVLESADGTFVAFCLVWLDEANGVGELEPVGVRPDHWRRGLGRAVCLSALAALRDAGARTAVVCAEDEAALALYAALGFERRATYVWMRR